VIEVQALPPLIETERTQQSNTINEQSVRICRSTTAIT
jgi:hypothetical protein